VVRRRNRTFRPFFESVSAERVTVCITTTKPGGDKLGEDKGINFPQSTIRFPAMTKKDIADLSFVVKHTDVVGLSFLRRPEDVAALQAELARLSASEMGIMLKIETRTAFEHLPAILLQAMRGGKIGVMIARGDLAVLNAAGNVWPKRRKKSCGCAKRRTSR
jgi:pyruvate kinase